MYTALCAVLAETMYEYFVESSEEEEEKIYLKFTQPDWRIALRSKFFDKLKMTNQKPVWMSIASNQQEKIKRNKK